MKKVTIACSIVLAACSAQRDRAVTTGSLDGGRVVLATFAAEVDLAAGTFVLRSTPTAAGRALLVLDDDVIVANKMAGDPLLPVTFFNADQGVGRACTDTDPPYEGKVWGATVTITSKLTDAELGGVYAEITSATPVTTLQSCSSVAAPPGLVATPGLWAYPNIAAGGTQEQDWVFKYETASKFSFAGRIVGVKIEKGDWAGTPAVQRPVNHDWTSGAGVVDAGSYIAVANEPASAPFGIDFVNKASGAYVKTVETPAKVNAMAIAPDRIWFGTVSDGVTSYVGWVNRDGSGQSSHRATSLNRTILAIAADGDTPSAKAWVLWNDQGNVSTIESYDPLVGLGGAATTDGLAYTMTVGSDGRAYVVNYSHGNVDVFTLGDTAAYAETFWAGECSNPFAVVAGPGGLLYLSDYGGFACTLSVDGESATLGQVQDAGVYPLAVSATGRVWVWSYATGNLWEVDTSGLTNANVLVVNAAGTWSLGADGNGALWYANGAGLWRGSP